MLTMALEAEARGLSFWSLLQKLKFKIILGNTTGSRFYGTWYADKMDLVYLPSKNELRCWWTMSEPEHPSFSGDPDYPKDSGEA